MARRARIVIIAAGALLGILAAVYRYEELRPRTEVHHYAVGAKDEVVAPYPCELRGSSPSDPPVVKVERWAKNAWGIAPVVFEARAPGTARFACSGATYVAEVRVGTRAVLEAPTTATVDSRFSVVLTLRDASGGVLEVGRYAKVEWTFAGAVKSDNASSCEFPPWCGDPPAGGSWVRATEAGSGKISASFGGVSASVDVTIIPAVDATTK